MKYSFKGSFRKTEQLLTAGFILALAIFRTCHSCLSHGTYLTNKHYHFKKITQNNNQPEDHWSCIAHLSVEDMFKSAVIDKKKKKEKSLNIALGQGQTARPHHYGHLLQV